jgi:hypothetical protein
MDIVLGLLAVSSRRLFGVLGIWPGAESLVIVALSARSSSSR